MTELLDALLVIVLVLNLFALGNGRIRTVIGIVAAQGAILAVIPLVLHGRVTVASGAAAAAALVLKAVVIPAIMRNSLEAADIKREAEPLVGILPSILLGAGATAATLLLSGKLSGAPGVDATLLVPASISTVLAGFILLVTRYKALSQALGYLVLENGIYIFGMLLVEAIPLVVEMGMLLDLFVGVFVISIITNHINEAFSSMDTRRLASLKE